MNVPLLGRGVVRHERLRPRTHAFTYPVCFLMLPLRSMRAMGDGALVRNRFALLSFNDRDHGDGGGDCLSWIDALLAQAGLAADGEVWLHCFPRVLGYAFKPVSFWYCHRGDGSLSAIVVEVNNTFGERHCYLLDGPTLALDRELSANKVFHVSPFGTVEGRYRFRFTREGDQRTLVRIAHDDALGPLLLTSVGGRLQPLTAAAAHAAVLRMPWMSLAVIVRIHWQALRLWLKRVPIARKPAPPSEFLTR